MPAFTIEQFGGALPVVSKRLLPPNFGSRAVNCDLLSGELRGIPSLLQVHAFPGGSPTYAKAMRIPPRGPTVLTDTWVGITSRRGAVIPYAISNDAHLRYVIVDGNSEGVPVTPQFNTLVRLAAGSARYRLGIPAPTAAPGLVVTGGSGTVVARSYVYTFVDSFGQEGQPSPPIVLSGFQNGSWDLSALETTVTHASERTVTTKRIYRTVFTNSGVATFRKVADVALAATTYSDTRAESAVAGDVALESGSFAEPPQLEGIVSAPNGFLVGWSDTNLYFSEPYRPWAWPPEYTLAVDFPILGCVYIDQTLVVITKSNPVFVFGSSPASLSVSKSEAVEAGVAEPSIVAAPDGVYFATKTGLLRASAGSLQNITQSLVHASEWSKSYGPLIKSAARWETTYVAMTGTGVGFMVDWKDPRVAFTQVQFNLPFDVIWTDQFSGQLFCMSSNVVYLWGDPDAGRENYLFRSKEFVFPRPMNLAAMLVEMDVGPYTNKPWGVQEVAINQGDVIASPEPVDNEQSAVFGTGMFGAFMFNKQGAVFTPAPDFETSLVLPPGVNVWGTIYANGRRVWQGEVKNNRLVRLPSGFKSTSWEFSFVGALPIYSVRLATNAKELQNA